VLAQGGGKVGSCALVALLVYQLLELALLAGGPDSRVTFFRREVHVGKPWTAATSNQS
jgi:hypothetical protein